MLSTSLRCTQCLSDSPRNAAPSPSFDFELLPSGLGQPVVFSAAVVFGVFPEGRNPTLVFHSVQSGKERARLNIKRAPCNLLDSARDSQAVHLASDKRLQDQQVQRSLQKRCLLPAQKISPIDIL